jgi:hypothetical protein
MQSIEWILGAGLIVAIIIVALILKKETYKDIDFSLNHGNEHANVSSVGDMITYEHLYQLPSKEVPYDKIRKGMMKLPEPTFRADFYGKQEDFDPLTNSTPSMYIGKNGPVTDFVSETKRCSM